MERDDRHCDRQRTRVKREREGLMYEVTLVRMFTHDHTPGLGLTLAKRDVLLTKWFEYYRLRKTTFCNLFLHTLNS